MRVAVDFDGVLHNPDDRVPGHRMGAPVAGAVQAVLDLSHLGHTVIVHSCRANSESGLGAMLDWLEWAGVIDDVKVWGQPGKPLADVYLDDRAVAFTGWRDAWSAIGLVGLAVELEGRERG